LRAVYIARIGLPETALVVRELPEPRPDGDQILVRVRAFGINFADILARTGMYLDSPRLPFIPGYEVAGVVEAVGPGCREIQVGQRVAALTDFGGYAECALASESMVVPIPDAMTWDHAASIPVNGTTAWLALHGLTTVRPGDRVLIHAAAGGVGLMAVQMALDAGCEVFGTVGSDAKVDFLKELGIHHAMNHTVADVEAEVRRATGGRGLDLILDSLGGVAIATGMRMLAASGRLVSIGMASMTPQTTRSLVATGMGLLKAPLLHPYSMLGESKSFIGVNLRRIAAQRPGLVTAGLRAAFELVAAGRIQPNIDSTYPFDRTPAAHERLHGRQSIGKVVVVVEQGEAHR
jgi:NADPH2:quinone reductase